MRRVWGDHSIAAMVSAMYELCSQLEKDKAAGIRVRPVTFVRVEGGNHFVSPDGSLLCRLVPIVACLLDVVEPPWTHSRRHSSRVI